MAERMRMLPKINAVHIPLIVASISAALLAAAHAFEHIGGLVPCELCLQQRLPHWLAIFLGILAFIIVTKINRRLGALITALSGAVLLTGAGIAAYHVGVEQHWWQGPSTCSAQSLGAMDFSTLEQQIMSAPLVSCDQITWSLMGISMAGYNFLISMVMGVAALWSAAHLFRKEAPL